MIHIPARIVPTLTGLSKFTNGGNKRMTLRFSTPVFAQADILGSRFGQCFRVYMATKPGDEDLRSLFELGHFHQRPKSGGRLTAEMLDHRVNFVKEVVSRGEAAVIYA